jgi:arylsulfatase A-like enzyme
MCTEPGYDFNGKIQSPLRCRNLVSGIRRYTNTFPKLLQQHGYQTAIVGKWHLGHGGNSDPTGFDYWNVLPGQGNYHNPKLIEMGVEKQHKGYATDLITDYSLDWLEACDPNKPFMLMCHHKAPHRPWEPDEKHMHLYEDIDIPEPETFNDNYKNRSEAAERAEMRVDRDLNSIDLKHTPPEGLTKRERKSWNYQRYIKDYLRCVASVDDNVGRMLDYLEDKGLVEDTIVVYTSDQGFFLGDHGWYDKGFMYEESLRMPFIVRYPEEIRSGSVCNDVALNLDFAETFLDYAGISIPQDMQGESLRPLFQGEAPGGWRREMYYRYWAHMGHGVASHYGVRTERYKLVYYYGDAMDFNTHESTQPEWEMFDLTRDPQELHSLYDNPEYKHIIPALKNELHRLQKKYKDTPHSTQL